ncbi:tyrosine-type recombinase/integrase [Halobacillus faecis]
MFLLEDLHKEFVYEIQVRGYTDKSIKGYKNGVQRLLDYLEKEYSITKLDQITTKHIKTYFMFLKKKGRKETYINGIHKQLRSFFKYCQEEEYLTEDENPVLKIKWMKEEMPIIKTFNDDEIRRMLNAYHTKDYLNGRNKLILMFLCDIGCRNSELCNITEIDVMETTIRIHGKGRKQRYAFISPYLKKFMIKYERLKDHYFKDRLLEHNNYFLSFTGKPLTPESIENIVRKAGQVAKVRESIRCSPHTLRHYFSQKMLESSDVYSVSRLLGHENIQITKRYLQSMEDERILDRTRANSPLMSIKGSGNRI